MARRDSSVRRCASASCSVIVLKDCVSTPSSSFEVTGCRREKSPCATAREQAERRRKALGQEHSEAKRRGKREQQREGEGERIQALQCAARKRDLLVIA